MQIITTELSNALYQFINAKPEDQDAALEKLRKEYSKPKLQLTPQQQGEVIGDVFNQMGGDPKGFAEAFCTKQHRTIQQTVFRYVMALIRRMAKSEHCDLRNQAAVNLARNISDLLDANDIYDGLPHI